jgi:hypothetical protein
MPERANVPDRVEADRLLPPPVVAHLLGVKVGTLQVWRARRQGPPYVVLSRRAARYSARALEAWIARHQHQTTAGSTRS